MPTRASGLGDVAVGADGTVWFLEIAANKIGRFAGGRFEEFAVPTPTPGSPRSLSPRMAAPGSPSSAATGSGGSRAGPSREFVLPREDARPFGIAVDAANNVWYTDLSGWVGRLDADRARGR